MALFRRNVVPMIIAVPSLPKEEQDYHDGKLVCPFPNLETYLRYNKNWTCKQCNIKYKPVSNGWTPVNPYLSSDSTFLDEDDDWYG